MKCYTPTYYSRFRCLASACPDSCCKEWEIDIDAQTAELYRHMSGPLGDKIRSYLRQTEDGTSMCLKDGKCPMWRQDGLCEIQAQAGHSALSQVCREFPRIRHDYGSFVEQGLELSCPEAARLILDTPYEIRETQIPGGEVPDWDPDLMAVLTASRSEFLHFMQRTQLPLPHQMAVLLLYGYSVQSQIDGGEEALLDPESDLQTAFRYAGTADSNSFFQFFGNLEILTPQWKALLEGPVCPSPWNSRHGALLRYLIGRYWLQAVSDYDLIGRIKFMIASTVLVRSLGADTVALAQLFSKEIENDPDNLDAVWDGAYTSPALTDQNLLSLLLCS